MFSCKKNKREGFFNLYLNWETYKHWHVKQKIGPKTLRPNEGNHTQRKKLTNTKKQSQTGLSQIELKQDLEV